MNRIGIGVKYLLGFVALSCWGLTTGLWAQVEPPAPAVPPIAPPAIEIPGAPEGGILNPNKLDLTLQAALQQIADRSVNAFAVLREFNLSVDARLRVLVDIEFQGDEQEIRRRIEALQGRIVSTRLGGGGVLRAQVPIRSLPALAEERFVVRIQSIVPLVAAVPPALDLGQPVRELPEPALEAIRAVLVEKQNRTESERKLDSGLLVAAKRSQNINIADGALDRVQPSLTRDEASRVLVDIGLSRADPSLVGQIQRLGGRVSSRVDRYRQVQAWLPLQQIGRIAENESVRRVRRAILPVTRIRNRSEGDVRHRADVIRGQFGFDGSGSKIGVLSNGVDSLGSRQAAGDLPENVTVLPGQFGVGDEGTAILEVINDLAPGAELMFATGFPSEAQMAQNILDLAAAGCDIIVDDVGHLLASVFQDGPAAQAVESVYQQGVTYFSAAGNSGNFDGGTSGVWEGDFKSSTLEIEGQEYVVHDFGGGIQFNELRDDPLSVISLQWSDPFGGSNNDYDLLLLDESGTEIVAISNNVQDGQGDPLEFIDSRVEDHIWYRLVIVKASGDDRYLRLDTFGSNIEFVTPGQVFGHPAAENAIAIGAVYQGEGQFGPGYFDGDEFVESFSSDGPRRVFFDPEGQPLTPGNMSASGGVLRSKPDLVAADGVSTNTPFFEQFFGTSAAAPHAAAISALLRQRGVINPQHIRALLEKTAVDVEAPGFDRKSGHGIVDAFMAMTTPLAVEDQFERSFETVLVFDEVELLANDLPGVGNGVLTLVDVTSVSDAGASVSLESGSVRYRPKAGFVGVDSFDYTLAEAGSSVATGRVSVEVLPAPPASLKLRVLGFSSSELSLRFEGPPSQAVYLEKRSDLLGGETWHVLEVMTLDAQGEAATSVENAGGSGFLRLRAVDGEP